MIGYRIKFQPNGSIHVMSGFVPGTEAPSTKLIFQPGDDGEGTMRLVDAEDGRYEQLQRFWVTERKSIPCLLANLTLEMFAKYEENVSGDRLSIR